MSKETTAQVIQCCIAIVIGCTVYWLLGYPRENPKGAIIGALAAGIGGSYLVMFLYIWIRFGWKAARSMSMDP